MPSFGSIESSRTLGTPIELFLFSTGAAVYGYTDAEDAIVEGGVTYQPVPVRRERITSSGTLDRSTLLVYLADTTAMAAVLRGYPVSSVITLVIRQGHNQLGVPFLVAWAGRVLSARGDGAGSREISCQPASTSLKRAGLRRNWQYGCPHALYGPQCRADKPTATVDVVATGSNRATAFLLADWNVAPIDRYNGGIVSWVNDEGATEVRTIQRSLAASLVLGGPASFSDGATLSISLGCDHTMNDCLTLHVPADEPAYGGGNIHNYGGQPFIPTSNPIGLARNY